VTGFAEAEEMDLGFWLNATPQERLRAVTELVYEMMEANADGSPPRLQRSIGGVRSLKG
jgi:hypothetical protein